ncbi:MAG: hypothetical protein IPN01_26200 [Deltaproteobacteria bacterium]|nr:hypothetical protein [Deltaproteobacteria bacterium]
MDADCAGDDDFDADGDGYASWEEVGGPDCLDSDASVWTCGSTKASAGLTCAEILSASPSSADGLYWVDPDGDGDTSDAWQAYCDMTGRRRLDQGGERALPLLVLSLELPRWAAPATTTTPSPPTWTTSPAPGVDLPV